MRDKSADGPRLVVDGYQWIFFVLHEIGQYGIGDKIGACLDGLVSEYILSCEQLYLAASSWISTMQMFFLDNLPWCTCKTLAKRFGNMAIVSLQTYCFPIETKQIHFRRQYRRKQMQYSWKQNYVSNLALTLQLYLRMTRTWNIWEY